MKYLLISIILLFITIPSLAQSIEQIDSTTMQICNSISNRKNINQEELYNSFQTHLTDLYKKFNINTSENQEATANKIFYRLQHNCSIFADYLKNNVDNLSDWIKLPNKPEQNILHKSCKLFLKNGEYFYKEYNGDIVNVVINDNSWTETFKDNTKSYLNYKFNEPCEFELEFIESNNVSRSNFSKKGDTYHYGIYNINNDVLDLWVFSKANNTYYGFKLYSKK
jgi:hypothetical protein